MGGNQSSSQIVPAGQSQNNNQRFSSHMIFQTNQVVTHKIQIRTYDLYFQPHNPKHTFGYLSKQFELYAKMPLILQNSKIGFAINQPIGEINKNFQVQKIIETIIEKLQDKEKSEQRQMQQIRRQLEQMQKENEKGFIQDFTKALEQKIKKVQYIKITLKLNYYGKVNTFIHEVPQNISYNQLEKVFLYKLQNIKSQEGKDKQEFSQNRRIIEIYNQQFAIITLENLKDTILNQEDNQINALIHSGECYFQTKSKILLYNKSKYNQASLEEITKENKAQIAALKLRNKKIVSSTNYTIDKKISTKSDFFTIELQSEQHRIEKKFVFFHKNQLVLNDRQDWIRVQLLKVQTNIYGINEDSQPKVILLTIKSIQPSEIKDPLDAFAISSPDYLNLIVDGIIVHNQNQINISCHEANQKRVLKTNIKIFPKYKFSDCFPSNSQCFYGNHRVQKHQTFGDYHMQDNDIIHIFNHNQDKFEQVIVSIRNSFSIIENRSSDFQNLSTLFHELRYDYLGIWNNQLISFSKQQCQKFKSNRRSIIHIIGLKNGFLNKLHFLQNRFVKNTQLNVSQLYQKYLGQYEQLMSSLRTSLQQRYIEYHDRMIVIGNDKSALDKAKFFPIFFYTTNLIYHRLNSFLKDQYEKRFFSFQNYSISERQWIPVANWINKSLQSLPNYEGVCYRGMKDASIQRLFAIEEGNQTISFNSFNSASALQKVAVRFSNLQGIIITFISKTGKFIADFSIFPHQQQVLFSPFVNFYIVDYNIKVAPQTLTLQEIPAPKYSFNNLIFWVDDKPYQNRKQSEQLLQNGIEVVEVSSTKMMQIIVKKFFKMYKLLNKKIVIVTDMARIEYNRRQNKEVLNKQAGFDLLEIIYLKFALTVKSFVYTSPRYVQSIRLQLQMKPSPIKEIAAIGSKLELKQAIYAVFRQKN